MEPSTEQRAKWLVPAIAAVLYFSEGFPYGIVTEVFPVYLRIHHVSLPQIALLNTVAFAWTAKLLWSPLVDLFGTYRRWIASSLVAIGIALVAFAVIPESIGMRFWVLATILALGSATQDLAVDAFTIRATPRPMLGLVNAIRVTAYRGAIMAGGGGLLILADRSGWRSAYLGAVAIVVVIFVTSLTLPSDRGERSVRHDLVGGLRRWLTRPHAITLLLLAFLYRLGEFAIVPMIKPFWVDRGYSATEIGTVTSIIGVIVSVAGAFAGGWVVARFGIWRALLWLGFAQSISNLGYALVASMGAGRWAMYGAAVSENFGFGLGTASFLAFLMAICDRDHAATEFALLTGAYGVTRTVMGSLSGSIPQHWGYAPYFWLTVFLGIPALLLLPRVREELSQA